MLITAHSSRMPLLGHPWEEVQRRYSGRFFQHRWHPTRSWLSLPSLRLILPLRNVPKTSWNLLPCPFLELHAWPPDLSVSRTQTCPYNGQCPVSPFLPLAQGEHRACGHNGKEDFPITMEALPSLNILNKLLGLLDAEEAHCLMFLLKARAHPIFIQYVCLIRHCRVSRCQSKGDEP